MDDELDANDDEIEALHRRLVKFRNGGRCSDMESKGVGMKDFISSQSQMVKTPTAPCMADGNLLFNTTRMSTSVASPSMLRMSAPRLSRNNKMQR
mmetsp:Transcript_8238/g.23694  ORF Transcript_8238/g.23694 Transcript_8238/m.23694 type:complete len:95 (+) Transcript_8238:223-507(+)|eukprot:CAMPEP_0119556070 /NCGR_PEP_ID=MMETSP1352-20130426/8123_1 /TAXON_ID=265584 /ORGANISM="Stauroneis constricta, Strain CCMP1120" /LENGTH=94 /DNA_ID=CAMNT_0007602963 /DNA_START=126 /DNA_END=410 /DNA_ORIENTATION=-